MLIGNYNVCFSGCDIIFFLSSQLHVIFFSDIPLENKQIHWKLMVGRWHFLLKWSLFRWHSFIFRGYFPAHDPIPTNCGVFWCFLDISDGVVGYAVYEIWTVYLWYIYIYITYDIGNPHIQIDGWNMMEGLCWCPFFFRNARMHSFRAQGGKNLDAGTLAAQCQREAWGSIYWTTSQK